MKKLFFSTLLLTLISNLFYTQSAPQLINYQAIAHDNAGTPLVNKSITVRIGIISDAINGPLEWEEDHLLTTNDYGLFTLKIGNGTSSNAGNQSSFSTISWKNHTHFLNVQVDEGFGFEDLGTQQLVSVPYALFAKEAETVTDPTTSNLIDNGNGSFTYFNEAGLMTTFNANINDADADPANELITSTNLNNASIEITEGTITHSIDLNPLLGSTNNSFWIDTTILGNSIIYNTDDRVGIGTYSPSAQLQVETNNLFRAAQFIQNYSSSSDKYGIYSLAGAGGSGENIGVQGEATFATTNKAIVGRAFGGTSNWAGFFEDGNVYIQNNLAIGNTNPSEKLHITNGSIRIDDGSNPYTLPSSDGTANQLLKTDGSGNLSWQTPAVSASGWELSGNGGTTNGTNFIGTTDAQDFDIRTNNVIRTRITQKGQIETLNTGSSVFIGENAGEDDDLSNNASVFIGYNAGKSNIDGIYNTSIGWGSMENGVSSINNVAVGADVLSFNEGNGNTGLGAFSMDANTTGNQNTAAGFNSLSSNQSGVYNTAFGASALAQNTTSSYNTAIGTSSLYNNIIGANNTVVGYSAMLSNTAGSYNTIMGYQSGYNSTGSYNVFLGYQAGFNETGNNLLYIDNSGTSNPLIYGDFSNDLLRINGTLNIDNQYTLPNSDGTADQVMSTDGSGNASWNYALSPTKDGYIGIITVIDGSNNEYYNSNLINFTPQVSGEINLVISGSANRTVASSHQINVGVKTTTINSSPVSGTTFDRLITLGDAVGITGGGYGDIPFTIIHTFSVNANTTYYVWIGGRDLNSSQDVNLRNIMAIGTLNTTNGL